MRADPTPLQFRLLVAGVHIESSGYPNVTFRLEHLRRVNAGTITEVNFPFRSPGFEHRTATIWKPLRIVFNVARLVVSHAVVLARILCRRPTACAYIPYPAVFLLFGLSLLPRRLGPRRIIADAFISLYDTIAQDRRLLSPTGPWARLLRHMETRAYARADLVVVDTLANAAYFGATFHLPRNRMLVAPLSTDETVYRFHPYRPRNARVRVLFVGTFVPLQGVDTIAHAALLLRDRSDIEIVLIGDGQTGQTIANLFRASPCPNVKWIREWQTPAQISRQIEEADICLGVFGTGKKTARVWPLKNYAYMAVGRPFITADTECAQQLAALSATEAFVTCPSGDAAALARTIDHLAKNPERRVALARASRKVYEQQLANDRGHALLDQALRAVCDSDSTAPA